MTDDPTPGGPPPVELPGVTVWHGDCIDVMRGMADSSVDAIVTDPPYGLGFMGKAWDDLPPGLPWAIECLRVLKPGGHMLAFGGTRTWHRLACAVEDAGFEIRDSIAWLYGSGFPKSLDVGKAIDKRRTEDRAPVDAVRAWLNARRVDAGVTHDTVNKHFGHASNGGGSSSAWMTNPTSRSLPTWDQWQQLKGLLRFGDDMDAEVWRLNGRKGQPGDAWESREVIGTRAGSIGKGNWRAMEGRTDQMPDVFRDTAPATDAARQWDGWGTALKPAFEPVVVARKPLAGTVAANVLAHGTGALNIDACRVAHGTDVDLTKRQRQSADTAGMNGLGESGFKADHVQPLYAAGGRWPANVVLDGTQAAALDQQTGQLTSGYMKPETDRSTRQGDAYGQFSARTATETYGDTGGASRFFPVFPHQQEDPCSDDASTATSGGSSATAAPAGTPIAAAAERPRSGDFPTFRYQAKAPPRERPKHNGVAHPTVKPVELMRWLVRLVTPPGGTVLDPFAGSGTTLEAARIEGFTAVGIERETDYLPLIVQRLTRGTPTPEVVDDVELEQPAARPSIVGDQPGLFDLMPGSDND